MTTEWWGVRNAQHIKNKNFDWSFATNIQRPVIFQVGTCLEYNWQSLLSHVPSVDNLMQS